MFEFSKPAVAALLVHMSRPLVRLEDIQPHPDSAEFVAAYIINHTYHSLAVAST
jgi:hypothetical protein